MKAAVTERLEDYRRRIGKFPVQHAVVDRLAGEYAGKFDEMQLLYLHVYAPVLTAYVEQVLQDAVQAGKKRLYFLARDAYPMYQAARLISAARNYCIECRYLRVSRYSMRLPEYQILRENCVERICTGGMDVTFDKIMRRAGLTPQESAEIAELCGYEPDNILVYREIMKLKAELKCVPRFLQYTYNHSKAAFADTIGYLEQEGMFEDVPYALVDSGWIGTLQQSIQNLLRTRQKKRCLEGWYFGLYEIPHGESPEQYHSFYFHPHGGMKRKIYFSNCLFETIYSHAEGMTLGYQKENGRFVPLLSSRPNPNAGRLFKSGKVLAAYVNEYLTMTGCRQMTHDGAALCESLLPEAMGRPRQWEVDACGDSLFCDDILEGTMQCVAAKLTTDEIACQGSACRIAAMLGIGKKAVKDSAWMEGSIVRKKDECASELRSVARYKRLVYIRKALKRW